MSGSNCCDPWTVHLFVRKPDGTFAARREVKFAWLDLTPEKRRWRMRGHSHPHLLDWNRDGRTDLVLDDPQSWTLRVGVGPLRADAEVGVRPFPLPELADRTPYDVEFTDWDGDGLFDAVLAGAYRESGTGPWLYDLYWCRNTAARGEPKFGPPVRLLTAPAQADGWRFDGYAIRDRGGAGRPDLVVSVSRNWHRQPKRGWTNDSRLWLYRRKAEPPATPDRGGR